MAQVMYFYKYPEKTKAVIPSHSNTYTSKKDGSQKTITQKAIPRNTPIDWENMRDTYSWDDGHVANTQDSAVANLMHYCGQSVHMHYGPSSGANFSAEAYIKYFGFDNSCYVGERRDYSIDDWFDMLYNEIEQGYPVLFSGFSSGGGHAFVLDGFDGDNLFHLNWGWGGGSNGWFLVGILNPGDNSGIGASSSSDGYSMGQRALFNLRLPDNTNADTYLFIKDVSVTSTAIKATFENRTGATSSFNAAIVKLDDDGGISVVGNQQSLSSMDNNTSQTRTFTLKNKLPEGTYKLSPASKTSRSKEWRAKYNLRNHYIEAVVDNTGAVTLTPVDISNGNSISIDTIVFPGTRIAGSEQEVKVTYRNNGDEYYKEVHFFASKTNEKIYTENRSMVAVRKGETVDVSYFFTPEETGTYNLWFCTGSNGSGQVGTGTMEIIEASQAVKANLSVTSYSIANSSNGTVYGNRLVGKANIKNNAKIDFHGKIRLQIWNQPNGNGSAWGGSSHTYSLDILAGKIASVDFDFTNLSENNKYYISASYVNQDGSLGNGGVWDLGGWDMVNGLLTWKNNGTIGGMAHRTSLTIGSNFCGIYADCNKITRMTPNKNPNTIYAFVSGMVVPASLDSCNAVSGNHAKHINLVSDKPFYNPVNFEADSASFTYTFPDSLDETRWYAFTMPFEADSIFLDGNPVSLEDSTKHFWIYEFSAQGDNGEVIFTPATVLRGATPYIIAADKYMAGRSILFQSLDVPFFKTDINKMVVTSPDYKFNGTTYSPSVKDCYVLNAEGTAFEFVTKNTTLTALGSYFTTNLPEELRPASIVLPETPVVPVQIATLDETITGEIVPGTYDLLTLKRTFDAGYSTICLPFRVTNVEAAFGQGVLAYEFYDFYEGALDFVKTETLAAGNPYIIYVSEPITEDIVLRNISIDDASTKAGFINKNGASFRGTYKPVNSDIYSMKLHKLTAVGTLVEYGPAEEMKGFRAFFRIPTDEATLHFYDDATSINSIVNEQRTTDNNVYDLSGRRVEKIKSSLKRGIYIVNGRKVIK